MTFQPERTWISGLFLRFPSSLLSNGEFSCFCFSWNSFLFGNMTFWISYIIYQCWTSWQRAISHKQSMDWKQFRNISILFSFNKFAYAKRNFVSLLPKIIFICFCLPYKIQILNFISKSHYVLSTELLNIIIFIPCYAVVGHLK